MSINKVDFLNANTIIDKTEQLLNVANNRYKITVQVAHRAKRRRYEDVDIVDDPSAIC